MPSNTPLQQPEQRILAGAYRALSRGARGVLGTAGRGGRRALEALNGVLARHRPPDYAQLPFEQQRIIDTVLWVSGMMALCAYCLFTVFIAYRSLLGCLTGLFVFAQPALSLRFVRRGNTTGAVIVLTIAIAATLDFFLLVTGGGDSTTSLWYVIGPCILIMLLPTRLRLPGIGALLVHQLVIAGLLASTLFDDLALLPDAGVGFDYVLSMMFAGGFGLAIAAAREQMVSRLARAKRDVRLAMTHILSGFFVVSRDGRMVVDASDALQAWLGGGREGDDVYTCLKRKDPALAEKFRVGFDTLRDGDLPVDVCLDQLPAAIDVGGRQYEMSYSVWTADGSDTWSRLILTLRDVTRERRSQEAMLHRQALGAFVRGLQRSRTHVEAQMSRAGEIVAMLREDTEAHEWDAWLDEIGLIASKNDLSAFGPYHEEAERAAAGGARAAAALIIAQAWGQVRTVFEGLHEEQEDSTLRASQLQYARLQELILRRAPRAALIEEIRAWAGDSAAAAIGGEPRRAQGGQPTT